MKRHLRVFALVLLIFLVSGMISCSEKPRSLIGSDDFLKVSGHELVTRDGEKVLLRGVNLGSWLIQECWMSPVVGKDGEWGNLDTIEAFEKSGMTQKQIQTLFETYQKNWITEYDLDIIRDAGANCVRVPFWYRNFMLDEAGTWISEEADENPGFKALDWVIEEAGERGMYVILDMHGCPGGQSMNHCCGTVGRKDLYTSETCRKAMKTLWIAIAERYRENPVVAAYDIMNEPQNNDGFSTEENYLSPWTQAAWDETNDLYREMVQAVREVDPEHIISVEGIWRIENLPTPEEAGWDNMLYQVHLYDNTARFEQLCLSVSNYAKEHNVAVYVGEFSNLDGIAICEKYGVNWTTWSYKGGKGELGEWFWYAASPTPVDPQSATYEEVLSLWGEALKTENGFVRNEGVLEKILAATKAFSTEHE